MVDSNDHIIVVGSRNTSPSDYDWAILKLYSNGTEIWNLTVELDGADNDFGDYMDDVALDSSNNIYVTGTISSNQGCGVMKLDSR